MARIDNSQRGVLISVESARRIAKAVQAYEQGRRRIRAPRMRTAFDDGDPLRLCRVPEDWPRGESLELEPIYETSCFDEGSGSSGSGGLVVENEIFDIAADSIALVMRAKNGCWYVVAAGCGDDLSDGSGSGGCCTAIGGQDLTKVDGYDSAETQVLAHQNGCLVWLTTTDCGSGS